MCRKHMKHVLFLIILLLSTAAAHGEPIIQREFVSLKAPPPHGETGVNVTPDGTCSSWTSSNLQNALNDPCPDLNRVWFYTYREDGVIPEASLILIPGIYGGASMFDKMAGEIILYARQQGLNLEVRAYDRRSNQLEDHTGNLAALEAARDGMNGSEAAAMAADYYRPILGSPPGEGDEIEGRQFYPIYQSDIRFMANWGVDTHLRDIREIVLDARETVGEEGLVFLGGHSLGTSMTTAYAAYDFDPEQYLVLAGHEDLNGIILLEGGGLSGTGRPNVFMKFLYHILVYGLKTRWDVFQKMEALGLKLGPDVQLAAGAAGVAAQFDPEGETIFNNLIFGKPDKATNVAAIALVLDDDFGIAPFVRTSLGFVDGPYSRVPFYLNFLTGSNNDGLFMVDTGFDGVFGWLDYEDPGQPEPSDGIPEVTNIFSMLPMITAQPLDFLEWYFPYRLQFDLMLGLNTTGIPENTLNITQAANINIPVLGLGGDDGLTTNVNAFNPFLYAISTDPADVEVDILPGYAHLDIMLAEENLAVPKIVDFIIRYH